MQRVELTIYLLNGDVITMLIHEYEIDAWKEKIIKGFLYTSKSGKTTLPDEMKPCNLLNIDRITFKRI